MKLWTTLGTPRYGLTVSMILCAILGYNLVLGDKTLYLPGRTTHGHHQMELQCVLCHPKTFDNREAMQQACESCHAADLEAARDTHPKAKFTDPRNAALLSSLDATRCVTCHVEHAPEITSRHGLTLPQDFCFYCHQDVAEERTSHVKFEYSSCSDSGCHSYHDNRALYEQFLAKRVDAPDTLARFQRLVISSELPSASGSTDERQLLAADHDWHGSAAGSAQPVGDWATSFHAKAGVNCSGCHIGSDDAEIEGTQLQLDACIGCHEQQGAGFNRGLHGMTYATLGIPLQVSQATLPMHASAAGQFVTCSSCHDPHRVDLSDAAVAACLQCHDDEHSRNYPNSPHSLTAQDTGADGLREAPVVSCAGCHMPRAKRGRTVYVEHNQSLHLKPNHKMLRPVCLNCHGLPFSLVALADDEQITSNFAKAVVGRHRSFELVADRLAAKRSARKN